MAPTRLPCPTLLRQMLRHEDGCLYWRARPSWLFAVPARAASWNQRYAGHPVRFHVNPDGYCKMKMFGCTARIYVHRVVFALHYGRWPQGMIDHANGNRTDNRIENLREATMRQNARNTRSYGKGSQFRGVSVDGLRWYVKCTDDKGKNRYVGKFDDEVEAARAYDAAALRWHGDFARLNFPVS